MSNDMPDCRVEVAWETPPRTRPADEDYTRIDTVTPIRRLTTRRGARIKTAELEAGEATLLLDNRSRALDPDNASSPWAPNVKERRRIRIVLEPEGDTERPLWHGFIDQLPIGWEVGDGTVELAAVDLLGLIAGDTLPPSVLHKVMLDSAPVAYWPLTERSGDIADDLAGTRDGAYQRPDGGTVKPVLPYSSAESQLMGARESTSFQGQRMALRGFTLPSEWTISAWVLAEQLPAISDPVNPFMALAFGLGKWNAYFSIREDTITFLVTADKTGDRASNFDFAPGGRSVGLLHLVGSYDGSNLRLFVNGVEISPKPGASDVAIAPPPGPVEFRIGQGFAEIIGEEGASPSPGRAYVGHVGIWDRILTAQEVADIYMAGTAPWEGDTIDQRMHRVLDLAGIDEGDRDIEASSVVLGPAALDGQNLVEYLRLLVATQPGGVMFVTADGRLAFRTAIPNEPTPAETFVGDPDVDAGVPYVDITLNRPPERVVNIAEVTRQNGITHRAENADSVEEWGPSSIEINTLHRTASGARGIGARLVNRFRDPRTVIESVELNGRAAGVTPAAALDLEVNDPAQAIARPTGGGDPIDRLVIVEKIEHDLDWQALEWRIDLALAEHVILPTLAWDTPGQGWDESVWAGT